MNTHILIPIKKINDEIARLTFSNTSYQEREESAMIEGRIFSLDSILTDYKQISLDEKNIKEQILEVVVTIIAQEQMIGTKWEDKVHLEKMKQVLSTLESLINKH